MWAANFVPFLTVFICFILNMVMVPMITQIIFGGSANSAGKGGEIVEKAIIYRNI
jgi:type IV secretion system protein VirB6